MVKTDIYKYPLFNSNSNKNGLNIRYSSIKHPNYNDKKVLFSTGRYIYPIYDNGEMGSTQGGIFIKVDNKEEGEKLIEYLNSNIVKFIIKTSKWSTFAIHKEVFKYIPNLINEFKIINNKKLYKYFELTKEQIEYIEQNI